MSGTLVEKEPRNGLAHRRCSGGLTAAILSWTTNVGRIAIVIATAIASKSSASARGQIEKLSH
jgi:hypothetical protein